MYVRVDRRRAKVYRSAQRFGARMVFRLVRTHGQAGRVRQVWVGYLGTIHEQ
jgi:hypothetical protein